MAQFDCEECGELDKYGGCKIIRLGKQALKITKPVIIQCFSDEFDLPNCECPTPARMGNVLTKANESDLLSPKYHTKYRSGVGKMMHVMQYSAPQIYNAVRDHQRHMSQLAPKHMKEMLHCMTHCINRPNRVLVLAHTRFWDDNSDSRFRK